MIEAKLDDAEVQRQLDRLLGALADLTPAMDQLGDFLSEQMRKRGQQGVGPGGVPWAPKSPATLELYRQRGEPLGFRPLHQTGEMLGVRLGHQADASGVEIGSRAIQAAVMQYGAGQGAFGRTSRGAPIPYGDIPARPFIGLDEEDRAGIIQIVEEWLANATE